jgi:hypothetical protein
MTGTRISNILPAAGIWLGCGLCAVLPADVITLAGDDIRLSGTVRSISEAGVVELACDVSPEPLLLKEGAVTRIGFREKESADTTANALLELINGDVLPVSIESMDDKKLIVVSPDAGRLEIQRDVLKSMQIGIRKRKVIYADPKAADEWKSPDPSRAWNIEDGGFFSQKVASASKKFDLPEQFILRFTLKWEARQSPSFKVCFADPLLEIGKPADRYFLQFGGAGLELKRESTKGKRYNTLKQLNFMPNQFANNLLKVEMRVDRKACRIRLFLNDEEEGIIADPISGAPDGSGITLECNTIGESVQRIDDLEILEYDDAPGRHRTEERGDRKNDSLISTEDDRWSGSLTGIRKSGAGVVFSFKSDFQKDALEISGANVSTIFFATKAGGGSGEKTQPFILRLKGDGSLHVSSCRLDGEAATVAHPLLGPLNLQRAGITGIEKSVAKSKPAPSDP